MKETKILQLDFTEPENIFPADMLLQMERANVKEFDGRGTDDYIVDYPICCYKQFRFKDQLFMVHLADPDAQIRIYNIPPGESFLALIESNNYQASQDVKIKFLVKD